MKDFTEIKKEICFLLVNREANQEMLEEYPHVEVLDLAMLFYHKRDEGFKAGGIALICKKDQEKWGVTLAEIYEAASRNTARLLPSVFQTIERVIGDIAHEENLSINCVVNPRERMYVLTNTEKYFGAGTFLYPDVLKKIRACLKTEFFVLPSSIHECIIMMDTGSVTASNLRNLIAEMNGRFLEMDEVLSNQIYRYDSQTDKLIMT